MNVCEVFSAMSDTCEALSVASVSGRNRNHGECSRRQCTQWPRIKSGLRFKILHLLASCVTSGKAMNLSEPQFRYP